MKLNCKAGDLAVIHGMTWTHEANGMVVSVVRRLAEGEPNDLGGVYLLEGLPSWLVEGHSIPARTTKGRLLHLKRRAIADASLRPIRDQPGEDETLTWAGLPQDAGVPA